MVMRASPNPFGQSTSISFVAPGEGPVDIQIFDVSGRLVRRIAATSHAGREQQVGWDGKTSSSEAAPSGVYFCRLVNAGCSPLLNNKRARCTRDGLSR